ARFTPDGGPARRAGPEVEHVRLGEADLPITAIEVEPREQILTFGGTQQLRVTAIDAAGNRRCVTLDAQYDSNAAAIAKVDARGWVQASDVPGQAALLVRFLGHVTVCRVTIPRTRGFQPAGADGPWQANFIDRLAWANLNRLGIPPADLADDATF